MSRLGWDRLIDRAYELGVDRAVLFVADSSGVNGYAPGVAWNGVVSVTEQSTGGEPSTIYADNHVYLKLLSQEEFGATIEVFQWPKAFDNCRGAGLFATGSYLDQQYHKGFAFCYRSKIGNALFGVHAYKVHIIYGCLTTTFEKAHNTVNDTPDPSKYSITVSTTPSTFIINGKEYKPTAHIEIDSSAISSGSMRAVEDALYGTDSSVSYLPTPSQIYNLIQNNSNYLRDCNGVYLHDKYGRFLCCGTVSLT